MSENLQKLVYSGRLLTKSTRVKEQITRLNTLLVNNFDKLTMKQYSDLSLLLTELHEHLNKIEKGSK